jgi:hypothetical protein
MLPSDLVHCYRYRCSRAESGAPSRASGVQVYQDHLLRSLIPHVMLPRAVANYPATSQDLHLKQSTSTAPLYFHYPHQNHPSLASSHSAGAQQNCCYPAPFERVFAALPKQNLFPATAARPPRVHFLEPAAPIATRLPSAASGISAAISQLCTCWAA